MTNGTGGSAGIIDSVDVLVVSWNGREHLETLLPALADQQDPGVPVRVRLFDNGSTDGTVAWVRAEHPQVDLLEHPRNIGFAAANNRLAERSSAAALALVNNDTRPRPDWLRELVRALGEAAPDVAAVSGCLVDWEGGRLDFGRGVMTFDGHAFQLDYHRRLADVELPAEGSELFFACGGNMIIRRDSFLAAGGFDAAFFAYLEDVDLGWRLWSGGERVLSAPAAVARHRSMVTSRRLGNANRGMLFERNAFFVAHKNYDAELWPLVMPAVQMTLLSRTQYLLAHRNPNGLELARDPFGSVDDPRPLTAAPRAVRRSGWQRVRDVVALRTRLRRVLRRLSGEPHGVASVADDQTVAQIRALASIFRQLDAAAARRRAIQTRRQRSDREILERFPLYLAPTYPGDEELFESVGFASLWPEELPLARRRLEELMEVDE